MENLDNNLQVSALTIGNNLTTRDVTSQDITVDGISIKNKLENIDEINKKRLILTINGKQYVLFGREIGG